MVGIPIAAHFSFSWIGFNPTDDGFTLAYSRRLLECQIPHKDFIIIRPALSPLMHVPVVALTSSHTYWVSRLVVWFQFAVIAWCWAQIIDKLLRLRLSAVHRWVFALIAFVFSVHYFPITAWHTVDALFLISTGLLLCVTSASTLSLPGIVLIASAYVCKQNFLLVAPAVIVLLGGAARARYWLAAATPGVAYVVFLAFADALPDAALQLTAQTLLLDTGVWRYLSSISLEIGALLGYFGSRLMFGSGHRTSGLALLLLVPAFAAVSLAQGHFTAHPAVGLFGVVLGMTIYFFAARKPARCQIAGILVLVVAWSVSISVGYNTPALAAGPLAAVLLGLMWLPDAGSAQAKRARAAAAVLAAVALLSFVNVRYNHVYRDAPAGQLNCALDGVLPGGAGIRTNQRTFAFIRDLRRITEGLGSEDYCIIPNSACWWAKAKSKNPLPLDWSLGIELSRPELLNRVKEALHSRGDTLHILVEKVNASSLAHGYLPASQNDVAAYVRSRFVKRSETACFEVYRGLKEDGSIGR